MISISLAIVVNLLTVAVVTGFQNEVKSKVSGFGAPIFITNGSEESILEANPIVRSSSVEQDVRNFFNIKNIQPVAYKAILLQSEGEEKTIKLASGKDTVQYQQEIQGCVFKGVDNQFDWSFFKNNLVEGNLPDFQRNETEVLISERIAKDLNFKVGDRIRTFFVKNSPVKRFFIISGIYSTGLEDFDKKFIIGKIDLIQKLNDWGISSSIVVNDSLSDGNLLIKAEVSGGNGNYRFDWGEGFSNYQGFTFFPQKDTVIRLIVSDYWSRIDGNNELNTIQDTSYLHLKLNQKTGIDYDFITKNDILDKVFLDETGFNYELQTTIGRLSIESRNGNGSSFNYISGYEVLIKDWDLLPETLKKLKRNIEFKPTNSGEILKVSSVIDSQSDIFVWLSFLDVNVLIILTLMLLIGIINMGSALLVLILVRTNFIGIMKAMGATDWSIRKIFLHQGFFLILKGLIWGNAIGLLICFIQSHFQVFTLNPEVYYLSSVPIELTFLNFLMLNIGTLMVCTLSLIIPSYVITKINLVKAIKFN